MVFLSVPTRSHSLLTSRIFVRVQVKLMLLSIEEIAKVRENDDELGSLRSFD